MGKFIGTYTSQKRNGEIDERLVDIFNRSFEIIPAISSSLLEQVHELRYQVYCCENNYEKADLYPDRRESDCYDSRSAHSLLVDKYSGENLGTVRIILPDPKQPSNSFPIQNICQHHSLSGPKFKSVTTAVEVSRFAISKKSRNDWKTGNSMSGGATISMAPLMALGLIKAAVKMSVEQGVSEWFAVMEPCLLRLFQRFGMYFRPIGPLVEYHGFRQPCHAYLYDLLERVRLEKPDIWEVITDEGRYVDHEKESVRLTS